MVQISRRTLRPEILNKISEIFFEVVGNSKEKEIFDTVILDLLSETERVMIGKRIAIMYLLLKKIGTYTICDVLKVSSSTVLKFKLILSRSSGIEVAFKRILRSDKLSLLLNQFLDTLIPPGTYGTSWSAGWERRKRINNEKTRGI